MDSALLSVVQACLRSGMGSTRSSTAPIKAVQCSSGIFISFQGSVCDQKPALNVTLLLFRSYLHEGLEVRAGYKRYEVPDFPLPRGLFPGGCAWTCICLCPLLAGWGGWICLKPRNAPGSDYKASPGRPDCSAWLGALQVPEELGGNT